MQIEVLHLDPATILLLEDNPHYMPPAKYKQLVENIKNDKVLTSTPFVWWNKERGGWEVLSGNHRIQASIEAGVGNIYVLATREELDLDHRLAIQISHNHLTGLDDPNKIKKLYERISKTELKAYAGLTDELPKVDFKPLPIAKLDYRHVSLLFLPSQYELVQEVIDKVGAMMVGEKWSARLDDFQTFTETIELIHASYNTRNFALALWVMAQVTLAHLDDLSDGWAESYAPNQWVPIATITGNQFIPVGAAQVIKQAIDKLIDMGEVGQDNKWQALEYICADWLSHVD